MYWLAFGLKYFHFYFHFYSSTLATNRATMITYSLKRAGNYTYLRASCYCDDERLEKNIGKCSPEEYQTKNYGKQVKRNIADIEVAVEKHESLCRMGRQPFNKADVEAIFNAVLSPGKKPKGLLLSDAITKYCNALRSGDMLRNGKPAGKGTITILEIANKFILNNTSLGAVPIESFNMQHVETLHKALIAGSGKADKKRILAQNTIASWANAVIFFFKYTYKIWHTNPIHKEDGVLQKLERIDHAVFYRTDEIMKLYALPLTGWDERVRDMFVYGCHTCMRISDHNAHSEVNITPDYIILHAIKGGSKVTIPLHPVVKEILAKYGGHPPKVLKDTFDNIIKRVCEEAKHGDKYLFHDTVHFKRTEGGKVATRELERWQLTSSHTMRRSFVTNAAIAGMPKYYIKRIGGWKSETAFERYFRDTDLDIAKAASGEPFFTDYKAG